MSDESESSVVRTGHRWTPFEIITAATAVLGTLIVCASTGVTAYQAWLSQKALTDAAESRRAWLQIDAKHLGAFRIDAEGANLMVLASVKNVGQTPALNVQRSIRMMPATGQRVPPCGEMQSAEGGPTAFPGETIDLLPMSPFVSLPAIERMRERAAEGAFVILVCVSYQTGNSSTLRTTGSTYLVERKRADRATVYFSLTPQEWTGTQVLLHRFSSNDEAT